MPASTAVPLPSADARIAVIGLGYVGLPLAVAFGAKRAVLGFDVDAARVRELGLGIDRTLELEADEIRAAPHLQFGSDESELATCDIFVVAVPTPIDASHQPDLEPLRSASALVARAMRRGALVVYESTVYPGTTEEICVPILERGSGLRFNVDFSCGYSPERVSPGDRARRLADIRKITSGSTPATADAVGALYRQVITAGTFAAPSIRVAEAAKVVENIQRDVNIALVNELALFAFLLVDHWLPLLFEA
ncbi:MAG: nucleotide sugar dehydrogenase, partial [Pseudoxanthomonas sp.]|nr:nucleotide sugar dehydrogenase [Pseudoxanthomonas sp.]